MDQPIGSVSSAEGAHALAFAQKTSAKNLQVLLELIRIGGQQEALETVLAVAKAHSTYQGIDVTKKELEKGTNIANRMTKTQIKYMREMLDILSKYLAKDPTAADQIAQWKDELAKIQKNYPNLTSSDINKLKEIFEGANYLASSDLTKHPREYQSYLNKEIEMFQMLQSENSSVAKQLEEEYQINLRIYKNMFAALEELETLRKILKRMEAGQRPSPSDLTSFLSAISHLSNRMKRLPQKFQSEINTVFEKLTKVISPSEGNRKPKNVLLSKCLGNLEIFLWTQEHMRQYPGATNSEISINLKQQVASWEKSVGSNAFTDEILQDMHVNLKSFPTSSLMPSLEFTHPKFEAFLVETLFFTKKTLSQASSNVINAGQHLEKTLDKQKLTLEREEKGLFQHNDLGKKLQKADANLKNKSWASQSLPNQFANDILNNFMPEQEKFLRILAESLEIANFGAGIFNEVLSGITGFSDANVNYTLSQWLTNHFKDNSYYDENPDVVNQQITNQKNQAITDEGNAEKQEAYVENQLKKIDQQMAQLKKEYDDGEISKSDYNKLNGKYSQMKTQLTNLSANLKQAITYLQNLINLLDQLHVQDVYIYVNGKKVIVPNESTIVGPPNWQSTLSTDEGQVINGYTGTPPPATSTGGLIHISGIVNGDQGVWGTQSQTAQTNLQMTMTVIQQEWSIVSTAEQLLNQMYLGVARGVNPR
ncbi:MAG: hypothetical protein KDK55_03685 [Chlamydiia bacterium]|nr:hypothetical protein [Chlamydiia bacterium]